MRRWIRGLVGTIAVLAALSGAALADVLHLTGGRRVEGKIVREDADFVTLESPGGRVRIDRGEIVKIERGKTAQDEFEERFEALKKKKDLAGLRDLAKWCGEKKLAKPRIDVWKAILDLDPNDAAANAGLGRLSFEGKWMTPAEKSALEAEREDGRKRAAGLVLHEGKWIPEKERDAIEQGLEKVGDEWLTKEEALRRQGQVEYEGQRVKKADLHVHMIQDILQSKGGVTLHRVLGPSADVLVEQSPAYAESVSRVLEAAAVELRKILGVADLFPVKMSEVTTNWTEPCVVLFEDRERYKRCARLLAENGYLAGVMLPGIESRGDGYAHHRPSLVTTVQRETPEILTANALHGVVVNAFNLHFPGTAPDWAIEGVGTYLQFALTGTIGGKASPKIRTFDEIEAPTLRLVLRAGVADGSLPRFTELFKLDVAEFRAEHYAQSVSLVHFLVKTDPGATARWMRALSEATRSLAPAAGDRWIEAHEKTLREAFGLSIAELEAKWREFVKKEDFAMPGLPQREK